VNVTASTVPADGIYLPSANTLGFSTNTTQWGTINSTGNWTINAPSSGESLTANTISGAGIKATAAELPRIATVSTGTSAVTVSMRSYDAGAEGLIGTTSNHPLGIRTNDADRIAISNTGNVTINAPTSGTALTVNGAINSVGDSSAVGLYIGATAAAIRYIQSGDSYIDYSSGSTTGTLHFRAGSGFRDTLDIGPNGNVTINAPTSGTALAISQVASGYGIVVTPADNTPAIRVVAPSTNSASINLTSTGKSSYQIYASGSTDSLRIYNGTSDIVTFATAGNVTINAPTSGAALAVTAATGGSTNAGLVVTGSASTPTSAVTFSATAMTLDCTKANVFTTTFTANVTTAPSYSNPQDGQTINWFITQDATGSRTMTWGTSVKWPGGTAGVLSTAANAVDLLVMTYRSSTGFWYATLSKGFA
jgi:hypothetical protein